MVMHACHYCSALSCQTELSLVTVIDDIICYDIMMLMSIKCILFLHRYYEWHTDANKKKQPYFIYFSQDESIRDLKLPMFQEFDYDDANNEQREKWSGHRLLTMAGIFDKWNPQDVSIVRLSTFCV